jgi:hypothetical protein
MNQHSSLVGTDICNARMQNKVEKTSCFEHDVTHVLCAKVTDARAETVT